MIIALIGNIGEGKSVTAVKEIVDADTYAVTNFNLNLPSAKYHRLKWGDIFKVDKNNKIVGINWEYWEGIQRKHDDFSIYLDEAHNLISARSSMTSRNKKLSSWVSQIRKILGDKENSHLWIITQTPRRIDVSFRELTHIVIKLQCVKCKDNVIIVRRYYEGFLNYELGNCIAKNYFIANSYFKYYDTKKMVYFKDAEQYLD